MSTHSDWSFTPDARGERKGIRFGLGAVRNLGPERGRSHHRGAREKLGRFTVDLRILRARGPERHQPAHDRKPDQAPARWIRWKATRAQLFAAIEGAMEAGQRALARSRQRAGRAVRRHDRRGCAGRTSPCPSPRLDRPRKAAGRERDAWLSTSPAIRSTITTTKSANWPRTIPATWKASKRAPRSRCAAC